jgi:hypothetical protein
MKYKCIKGFSVYQSDDDGGLTDDLFNIEVGTEWEVDESGFRMVGNLDDVRLESENGSWLEITKEHLKEFFERVEG